MKRILLFALLAGGCGVAPELELAPVQQRTLAVPTATATTTANDPGDDGSSNPMPGRPTAAAPGAAPTNPAASNPMPGTPAPIVDPQAPGSSNPMPGVAAVVDYTR